MLSFISVGSCFLCGKCDSLIKLRIGQKWGQLVSYQCHASCFLESSGEDSWHAVYSYDEWKELAGEDWLLNDKHCIEYSNGAKEWWVNGERQYGKENSTLVYQDG